MAKPDRLNRRFPRFVVAKALRDSGLDVSYRMIRTNHEAWVCPYRYDGNHGTFAVAAYYPFPNHCDVCLPVMRDCTGEARYFQSLRYGYEDIPLPTLPEIVIDISELVACTVIEVGLILLEGGIRLLLPKR